MKNLLLTLTLLTVASAQALTDTDRKLFDAVDEQSLPKVKAALNEGANINAMSPAHETPLLGAVYRSNASMVKFLIKESADCNVYNSLLHEHYNLNPLIVLAAERYNFEILSTLLGNISSVNQRSLDAALIIVVYYAVNIESTLKETKENPCPCNYHIRAIAKCTHGKLVPACTPCMKKLVTLLLQHGASPTAKDSDGESEGDTAYEMAKKSGQKELIKLLSPNRR